MRLVHERIEHREADSTLTLTLRTGPTPEGDVGVLLTGDWVHAVDLRGIVPEPGEQVSTGEGLRLLFPVAGASEVHLAISYRAQRIGVLRGGVSALGGSLEFWQVVLP